jgi:hypothetical protein
VHCQVELLDHLLVKLVHLGKGIGLGKEYSLRHLDARVGLMFSQTIY